MFGTEHIPPAEQKGIRNLYIFLSYFFSTDADLFARVACPLNKFNADLLNLCFPEDLSSLRGRTEQNAVTSTESFPDQTTLS